MKHSIHSMETDTSFKNTAGRLLNILLYGWYLGMAALNTPSHCTGTSGRLDIHLLSAAIGI